MVPRNAMSKEVKQLMRNELKEGLKERMKQGDRSVKVDRKKMADEVLLVIFPLLDFEDLTK